MEAGTPIRSYQDRGFPGGTVVENPLVNAENCKTLMKESKDRGFPGGTVVGSPPADAGDAGSCPGPGRSHMPQSN